MQRNQSSRLEQDHYPVSDSRVDRGPGLREDCPARYLIPSGVENGRLDGDELTEFSCASKGALTFKGFHEFGRLLFCARLMLLESAVYRVNGNIRLGGKLFWRVDYFGQDAPFGIEFLNSPAVIVRDLADAEFIEGALNERARQNSPALTANGEAATKA
jgi:hypothetical protein